MIRITIGDIRKAGLHKLRYGPNTQIAREPPHPAPRHRHPGSHSRPPDRRARGHRAIHAGRRRACRWRDPGCRRGGTGHGIPTRPCSARSGSKPGDRVPHRARATAYRISTL